MTERASWVGRTVVEIAAAVRSGDADPRQVITEHLDHIERLNPRVGAFVAIRRESALAEAAAVAARGDLADPAAAPLAGVPIAVKDNVAVAGEPTRYGTALTAAAPASADHELVRRLRAAGAVIVGITRMPELGVWATSEDAAGAACNPWDLDRTPGGSSGGSAAAVAAAMVPGAHGNDGLGSIRIPAAACGVVGIKPGPGVVPRDIGQNGWRGLVENGPMATTVADAALLLSVMADRPDLAVVDPSTERLVIAGSTAVPVPGVSADPQIQRAVVGAALALREAGHELHHVDPPYSQATANAILAWYTAATADEVGAVADATGLEPRQRRHAQVGRVAQRLRLVRERDRQQWQERAARFFDTHDVVLTPVLTSLPPVAAGWRERSWTANLADGMRWAPMASWWNFAGYPAATVPVGMHSAGMPIGVQIVVAPGQEARLLSVAAELERRLPWTRHAPLATTMD